MPSGKNWTKQKPFCAGHCRRRTVISFDEAVGTNYILITLGAVIFARHGISHAWRLFRLRRRHHLTAMLAALLVCFSVFALVEGFVTGFFSGSRFWGRPDWWVFSNVPAYVRFFAPVGIWGAYFALYGRKRKAIQTDIVISALLLVAWWALWNV